MGSSSKPKPGKQPKALSLSGDSETSIAVLGAGGGGIGVVDEVGLEVELINIDVKIAGKVSVGDFVTVDLSSSPLVVSTRLGRIGDIPSIVEKKVKRENLSTGSIVSRSMKPLHIRVALRK